MTWNRTASRSAKLIAQAVLLASTALAAACNNDPSAPAGSRLGAPSFTRTTSDVVVSSAVPDSASQDTTLDVTINGSGFVSGAVANWALAGVTDATQVRTNSTRFVNGRTLVANITISGTATLGKWDVVVYAGTKGGIGSELFTIKLRGKPPADPTSTFYLSNSGTHLLRGDGLYLESNNSPYSGMSRYVEAECGVHSQIFATAGGSGDAIMGSNFTVDRKCRNYPRGVRLSFSLINSDGSTTADGTEAAPTFMNLKTLEQAAANGSPAIYIPVGSTELRSLLFNDHSGKCAELRFRPVLQDGTITGSDQVQVTRTAADTWIVQTRVDETDPISLQPIHHDKVWCQNNGKLYHMPTYFVIKSVVPLSP